MVCSAGLHDLAVSALNFVDIIFPTIFVLE